jgi:hypothetical protein
MKTKQTPKAKKYVYTLKGENPLTKGMILSFREDNRKLADIYAQEEALFFGEDTKAVFKKEI